MQTGKERRLRAGVSLARAREQLRKAVAVAKEVAAEASHDDVPETTIAEDLGVSRMTVRNWLGK